MIVEQWTRREVRLTTYPGTDVAAFEHLVEDALPDALWGHWWPEPSIGSVNRQIQVGGLPWWVPPALARRILVAIAARHGVYGDAQHIVFRTSLVMADEEDKT